MIKDHLNPQRQKQHADGLQDSKPVHMQTSGSLAMCLLLDFLPSDCLVQFQCVRFCLIFLYFILFLYLGTLFLF